MENHHFVCVSEGLEVKTDVVNRRCHCGHEPPCAVELTFTDLATFRVPSRRWHLQSSRLISDSGCARSSVGLNCTVWLRLLRGENAVAVSSCGELAVSFFSTVSFFRIRPYRRLAGKPHPRSDLSVTVVYRVVRFQQNREGPVPTALA